MVCANCGSNIDDNSNFCTECGSRRKRSEFCAYIKTRCQQAGMKRGNYNGKYLESGFTLKVKLKKSGDKWNVESVENLKDYVKTVRAGRNAAALKYVESEQPLVQKFNAAISDLNDKFSALSTGYVDGYEAALNDFVAGREALTPPESADDFNRCREKWLSASREQIRLLRQYIAGDHSEANKAARLKSDEKVRQAVEQTTAAVKRLKMTEVP